MRIATVLASVVLLGARAACAAPAETEIPNVTAEVVELRSSGGVTRLAVRYVNGSAEEAETKRFEADKVVLVDVKSKKKHFPIKDAKHQFIAGPIGDAIGGGRIYVTLPPGRAGVLWAYFEALPAGASVSVEIPQMFPFEDVVVTEGAGTLLSAKEAKSTPAGAMATLISAKRADEALKARLKLAAEPGMTVDMRSPYFRYADVYLFDPVHKRKYPLLEDSEGIFQATPLGQKIEGGTFLPKWTETILMSLTFQAPPDDVTSVDLVLPDFLPIEGVPIEGLGGASAGGIAAAGETLGLEGALEELKAEVTPQQITIDLSADVLFDFDQSTIKKEAEPSLRNVATVLNANPGAAVTIEGHTDAKGAEAYNQTLSERRAASVKDWLVTNAQVNGATIATRGWGKSKPIAENTKPDGSDDPEGRARNRRVQIIVRKHA